MKKLLILVPNLQLGGQERVAVNTAEVMKDIYDITFVIFDGRGKVYTPPCEVVDLSIPDVPGMLPKIKKIIQRACALRSLKKEKHIDFALSFGPAANLTNVLSGNSYRTFTTLRGYDLVSYSLKGRFLYRHCHSIICVSKVISSELSKVYQLPDGKAVALYNPYDVSMMLQMADEQVTDYHFTPHTIVTQGRLEYVKNYPRLIKAFALVHAEIPDAQLLLIGEGSQRTQLVKLIKYHSLEICVTLLGFRKNPFAYLSKSSLYVLSSYAEGFPNSLVEAMTFLPVVAVDCKSGPREILSDGPMELVCEGWEEVDYGILVQPTRNRSFSETLIEEDRILAEAMLSVLTDPEKTKTLQEKAKYRAQAFSHEAYRMNLMKILEE